MAIKKKTLLIAGGGAVALAMLAAGTKKALDLNNVVQSLEFSLARIRWPQLFGSNLRIKIDLKIKNPTATPLDIKTAGLVRITEIVVLNKAQKEVGRAQVNLDAINVPAFGQTVIKDVEVKAPVLSVLSTITQGSTNPDDYIIYAQVEAAGKTFFI